jgi:branched-chain amino acid transport system ATP-binding protein
MNALLGSPCLTSSGMPIMLEVAMSNQPVLEVDQLEVRYGAIEAIKGISLHVNAGDVTQMPGHLRVSLGIAQSPEGRQVFPDQTVLDNLLLGAFHRKDSQAVIDADVEEQFRIFPRLKERQEQMAGTLSGGEQQMLAIGRALMSRPTLLLMDEPSLGLAPLIVKEIFGVIRALKERGVTILLVEQMANQALAVADRAYVLETGRITLEGKGAELRRDPKVRAAYLGAH